MTTMVHTDTLLSNSPTRHDQYFTFMLAEEEYGLDILTVVEIRGLERLTAIPSAPRYIKGVINLRGSIVPVMDLRERFQLKSIPYNRQTVVVVLQLNDQKNTKDVGIIVDAVSDVYTVNPDEIKPKPEICDTPGQDYIVGLANVHVENKAQKLIILLDPNKLILHDELDMAVIEHEKN